MSPQLMHPVLESLRDTDRQWLIDTLYAFNSGNVERFQSLRAAWGQQVSHGVGGGAEHVTVLIPSFSTSVCAPATGGLDAEVGQPCSHSAAGCELAGHRGVQCCRQCTQELVCTGLGVSQMLPKEERLCVTLRVRSKEPSAAEEALSML